MKQRLIELMARLAERWAAFREWLATYEQEEHYCPTCSKYTVHTKERGCLECDWITNRVC